MVVPAIPPASERPVRAGSPVTVHVLVASRLSAARADGTVQRRSVFQRGGNRADAVGGQAARQSLVVCRKKTIPPFFPDAPHRFVAAALMSVSDVPVTLSPASVIPMDYRRRYRHPAPILPAGIYYPVHRSGVIVNPGGYSTGALPRSYPIIRTGLLENCGVMGQTVERNHLLVIHG